MRVYEVAKEFNVSSEMMIQLLRGLGVSVRSEASSVDDPAVAKLRARFERERRAGRTSAEEVLEAMKQDAQASTGRRRRRRRRTKKKEPEAEVSASDSSASPTADAADQIAAEAAEEAADRDADLVTRGGKEPTGDTVVVGSPGPETPEAEAEAAEEPEAEAEEAEAVEEPEEAEAAAEAEEAEEAEAEAPDEEEPETAEEPAAEAEEAEEAEEPDEAEEAEAPEAAEAEAAEEPEAAEADEAEEAEAEAPEEEEAEAAEEKKPAAKEKSEKKRRPKRVSEVMPGLAKRRAKPAASAGPGGKVRIQKDRYGRKGKGKGKGKRRKKRRKRVDQDAVQENVQRVMAELKSGGGGGGKKKRRRSRSRSASRREEQEAREQQEQVEEVQTVRVNEYLTVAELAELIEESSTEIITSAFKNLGLMVTINQRLDFDQIELLLDEFGYKAVREEDYGTDLSEEVEQEDRPEDLAPRPPVVTVMGHVDHGKTSLLDYIRKENVIAGESGGITQHIGAYHVKIGGERSLTFLDTPGHAAFTAMRARGADVTDVVILVIAADDAVMPQTIEAISHAKNAGVPLVIAINKIDLPTADVMKVKQSLLEHEVVVEEFGGDVLVTEVSAKTGDGVDELLEQVSLQADLLELQANPTREAQGTVIESQIDTGKGPVATVLVTNGTLHVGDAFVCGLHDGRVRALLDERGNNIDEVGPGMPAQVLGLSGVPEAGDMLVTMDADRATEVAQKRQRIEREKKLRVKGPGVKLTDISEMMAEGEAEQLNIVIKGDVGGSVQALSDSLEQLSNDEVQVDVIHRGVGAINESDVLLAQTSGAIIIGFHVRPDANARSVAEREGVDIRSYNVIYEAVDDVRSALEGMLEPEEREVMLGVAEVRQLFKVPRAGTVAGCYITEGVVDRRAKVRVVRDGVQIYDGELDSLKRFKDDVSEVREGFECGMSVAGFNDIKVGDDIECYRIEQVARTLASTAGAEGG